MPQLDPLTIVAAYSVPDRVIGNQGKLPWHEPEDLKHFKTVTSGHVVIMGRKTWDSLGKPLPKRLNLVVTRQPDFVAPGAIVFPDLNPAIEEARKSDREPCVIGGAEIYKQALPRATTLILTEVHMDAHGDAFFPPIVEPEWQEEEIRKSGRLVFRLLRRVPRTAG